VAPGPDADALAAEAPAAALAADDGARVVDNGALAGVVCGAAAPVGPDDDATDKIATGRAVRESGVDRDHSAAPRSAASVALPMAALRRRVVVASALFIAGSGRSG
jgi:hypothetical protein